jgi:hypothetical protein
MCTSTPSDVRTKVSSNGIGSVMGLLDPSLLYSLGLLPPGGFSEFVLGKFGGFGKYKSWSWKVYKSMNAMVHTQPATFAIFVSTADSMI